MIPKFKEILTVFVCQTVNSLILIKHFERFIVVGAQDKTESSTTISLVYFILSLANTVWEYCVGCVQ